MKKRRIVLYSLILASFLSLFLWITGIGEIAIISFLQKFFYGQGTFSVAHSEDMRRLQVDIIRSISERSKERIILSNYNHDNFTHVCALDEAGDADWQMSVLLPDLHLTSRGNNITLINQSAIGFARYGQSEIVFLPIGQILLFPKSSCQLLERAIISTGSNPNRPGDMELRAMP